MKWESNTTFCCSHTRSQLCFVQGGKYGQACGSQDTHRANWQYPKPIDLIERIAKGDSEDPNLAPLYEDAVRDTIERFEATGSPVVTDGEQRKYHNFCTYCVHGLPNTAPDGFKIPFSDGNTRRPSRITRGPFRSRRYADSYWAVA